MALLFVGTALGTGVYAFWQNTQGSSSTTGGPGISCATAPTGAKFSGDGTGTAKLQGTKLVSFTPLKPQDHVSCTDFKVGTGAVAMSNSTITATYTGALAATGVIFQSSLDSGQPFTSALSQVIPGWAKGIVGMKVGGERRIVIPAFYAYGSQAQAGIPANSDLVFDVTLLNVQ